MYKRCEYHESHVTFFGEKQRGQREREGAKDRTKQKQIQSNVKRQIKALAFSLFL